MVGRLKKAVFETAGLYLLFQCYSTLLYSRSGPKMKNWKVYAEKCSKYSVVPTTKAIIWLLTIGWI